MTARLVTLLSGEQQQVLPIAADRITIGPARAAWLERTVVPAQDFERGRLAHCTTTDRVDDLSGAKEEVAHLTARADAHDALAPGQTLHLHEIRETRAVQIRAKAALSQGVG